MCDIQGVKWNTQGGTWDTQGLLKPWIKTNSRPQRGQGRTRLCCYPPVDVEWLQGTILRGSTSPPLQLPLSLPRSSWEQGRGTGGEFRLHSIHSWQCPQRKFLQQSNSQRKAKSGMAAGTSPSGKRIFPVEGAASESQEPLSPRSEMSGRAFPNECPEQAQICCSSNTSCPRDPKSQHFSAPGSHTPWCHC